MGRTREFDAERALRKAMTVFWTRGFEATSIADLTAAMEISRSSFYAAFGDKQRLFDLALQRYVRDIGAERMRALREAQSVRQGLTDFFEHHVRVATDPHTPAGCFVVNTALEIDNVAGETGTVLAWRAKTIELAMQNLLKRGVARGEVAASRDLRALARMLVALSAGINVMARFHRKPRELRAVARAAIESVLRTRVESGRSNRSRLR